MQIIRHTNPNCVMADIGKKLYDCTIIVPEGEDTYYFTIAFIPKEMTDDEIISKYKEEGLKWQK